MANETVLSALTSDQAEAVRAAFLLLLADRNWLGGLPTLHYGGFVNGSNSNVVTVPHWGLMGYDVPVSTAEASDVGNTVLSDGKTQITVAKSSIAYEPSDIVKMILEGRGVFDPGVMAQDALAKGAARLSDLICDVIDGFTATSTPGSGVDLDIPTILAAVGKVGTLNCDTSRGFTGALHGQQWSDITVDSATTGGAVQFTLGQDIIGLKPGHKGLWLGVDWYHSNRVVTANAGADRAGAIWAYGGVVWADGLYSAEDMNQLALGHVLLERERNAKGGRTSYVVHTMLGVAKALEAGVTIISDA